MEVVLALRRRWPQRPLRLQTRPNGPGALERRILFKASIDLITSSGANHWPPAALHRQSRPIWLAASGLPVDGDGRLRTDALLRVEGCEHDLCQR